MPHDQDKQDRDNLFAETRTSTTGFRFDENVVRVFPDMISRSVPGYELVVPMIGMLAPTERESILGQAEVRQTFKVPKLGIIAGCYVTDGKVARNAQVRLLREHVRWCSIPSRICASTRKVAGTGTTLKAARRMLKHPR